jgi:hypothetical protein
MEVLVLQSSVTSQNIMSTLHLCENLTSSFPSILSAVNLVKVDP